MAETSDVRSFKDEISAEFARDREIEHVRVRSLELVVQAPVDGERARVKEDRRCNNTRKRRRWRTHHLLVAKSNRIATRIDGPRRKGRQALETWPVVHMLRARRIP